jgi:hypothetical protein
MLAVQTVLDHVLPGQPPTVRDKVLAFMHVHAVLPRLGDLARLDPEAKGIVAEMDVALEFRVLGGPRGVLTFRGGQVTASRTASSNAALLFPSCAALNRMFAGEKVTPIPYKGLHHFADLKRFEKLTAILTRYLKPSDDDMKSAAFRARHVELSLLVGLAATREVADLDPRAARLGHHLPNGTIQYRVGTDGPRAYVEIRDHVIRAAAGELPEPTTTIDIRDVDLADEYNQIFDRVGLFLS